MEPNTGSSESLVFVGEPGHSRKVINSQTNLEPDDHPHNNVHTYSLLGCFLLPLIL